MGNFYEEFPSDFIVPAVVANYAGIVDTSWGNDICPTFTLHKWRHGDDEPIVMLWADHPDPSCREMGGHRFKVTTGDDTLYDGDDPLEALAALELGKI